MKAEIDELEAAYDKCVAFGWLKEKNSVDIELIGSLFEMAKLGLEFVKRESLHIKKGSTDWTFVFRDYYESLRALIEAFLLFDKITGDNHMANNAYICLKHPELELNWEFLEGIRLKRNAINYCGQLLAYEDWSMLKLEFELHISRLEQEIAKRIKGE